MTALFANRQYQRRPLWKGSKSIIKNYIKRGSYLVSRGTPSFTYDDVRSLGSLQSSTWEISTVKMWPEKAYSKIMEDNVNLQSTSKTLSSYRGYGNECTPSVKASSFSPFQFMAFSAITISTIINIVNAINNNNNNNDNNNNNNLVSFNLVQYDWY